MAADLKRVKCGSITDALISATEQADKMAHVLIIYEGAGDDPGGMICDDGMDIKSANFIADQLKFYLWRNE